MYNVAWDVETGGIVLLDNHSEGLAGELRPVFHEELDLLGFSEVWRYPQSREPLLWAIGRRYYYCGEWVAEAKGGGFFERPQIVYQRHDLSLRPVDVEAMVARNDPLMEGLVFRAIEFIRREYEVRRRHSDVVAVAFSGGKDSLVVLDLVQRALPPDAFVVVFNDTGMELSVTHEAVERAKQRWPQLRFYTARSHMSAEESWRAFGPPSRIMRWCCGVHKSAPTLLLLRELAGAPTVRALMFDGIRWAESQRRSTYAPVSEGKKHQTQTNASPIIGWNSSEVFLYLLSRNDGDHESLLVNEGYRHGLARVGCAVCPFNSVGGESILGIRYPKDIQPLILELRRYAAEEVSSHVGIDGYINQGIWKTRSGGRAIGRGTQGLIESETASDATYILRQPRESWREWAKALGSVIWTGAESGAVSTGIARLSFTLSKAIESSEVHVRWGSPPDRFLKRDIRALANKAVYCVHCRVCEVECPTGALSVDGRMQIDENKCIHCRRCLNYVDKGCWVAKSRAISLRGAGMKGINAYQTFGLSSQWLDEYFVDPQKWWKANSLGPRQFEAMQVWLDHAGITDRARKDLTPLGAKLREFGSRNPLTWYAIWVNLAEKSVIVNWYVRNAEWHRPYTKRDLVESIGDDLSERTRDNAIASLVRLIDESPLGHEIGIGRVDRAGRVVTAITRLKPRELPNTALLYCLYRYAERADRYGLSVHELLEDREGALAQLFGINEDALTRSLRSIASLHSEILHIDVVRDLDSVYLEPSTSSVEALFLER